MPRALPTGPPSSPLTSAHASASDCPAPRAARARHRYPPLSPRGNQVREIPHRPDAQSGNVRLARVAGRPARWLVADPAAGFSHRIDEVQGGHLPCLGRIPPDRLVDDGAARAREGQTACRSLPEGFTEPVEMVLIGRDRLARCRPLEKQLAQMLAVPANQLADVLARASVAAGACLIIHEDPGVFGQRDVHIARRATPLSLARFGKIRRHANSMAGRLRAARPGSRPTSPPAWAPPGMPHFSPVFPSR